MSNRGSLHHGDAGHSGRDGQPFDDSYINKHYWELTLFDYQLADGTLRYQKCRYDWIARPGVDLPENDKKFLVRRPDRLNKTKYVHGAGDRHVIFNWPAIMAAGPGAMVIVTEGEKNALDLIKAGLLATCVVSPMDWTAECVAALADRDLIILEDNDKSGRKIAANAKAKLSPVARTIRVVSAEHLFKHLDPPRRLIETYDVSDWINLGGDLSKLIEICCEVPVDGMAALPLINISTWDDEPVPQQEWAVKDRIPLCTTALFSGEGAAGKSLIQLQQSVAHVIGREWFGTLPRQGPAIFIDAEDDERVIHLRLADVLRHYNVKFADVLNKLHLVSLAGEDAVLAVLNRKSGRIEPTPRYAKLLEMAGDIRPVMIGIASTADVFAGNEINRSEVQQFIALLTRIARTANGSVNLISHPSLTGISTDTGISGTTQWHNSVRARSYLKSAGSKGGEERDTNLRILEFKKNNYGPVSESILLRYENGLFVPVMGKTATQAERDLEAEDIYLSVLTKLIGQNQDLGADKHGSNYAPAKIAAHPDANGFSRPEMEAAQQRLLDAGKIHIKDTGPPSKRRKYIFPGPDPDADEVPK